VCVFLDCLNRCAPIALITERPLVLEPDFDSGEQVPSDNIERDGVDSTSPGPADYGSFFYWPSVLMQSFLDAYVSRGGSPHEFFSRMESSNIILCTNYSGVVVIAMHCISEVVRRKCNFVVYSACDSCELPQRCLKHHPVSSRAEHLLSDVLQRVDAATVDQLSRMQAQCTSEYLEKSAQRPPRRMTQRSWVRRCHRETSGNFLKATLAYLGTVVFDRDVTLPCMLHPGSRCRLWPERCPNSMVVEIGGHTCTPWSATGKQEGWLSKHSLIALVCFSVGAMQPDRHCDQPEHTRESIVGLAACLA
jgi:hypothetical protein